MGRGGGGLLPFRLGGLRLPFLIPCFWLGGLPSLLACGLPPSFLFKSWLGGLSLPPAFLVGRSLFVFWAGWSPRSLRGWAVSLPCWLGVPSLLLFGASPLPSWLASIFGSAVFPSLCLLERKEKRKEKKKKKEKKEKKKRKKEKERKKLRKKKKEKRKKKEKQTEKKHKKKKNRRKTEKQGRKHRKTMEKQKHQKKKSSYQRSQILRGLIGYKPKRTT